MWRWLTHWIVITRNEYDELIEEFRGMEDEMLKYKAKYEEEKANREYMEYEIEEYREERRR